MGNLEIPLELNSGMQIQLPGDVVIVAEPANIEWLQGHAGSSGSNEFAAFNLIPLAASDPVPVDAIASASVLVMEVDTKDKDSLRRVSQVKAQREDLPVIVALSDAGVDSVRMLIRQGVADVAVLPFERDELLSQILDAAAKRVQSPAKAALAPLIAVVRSTGGCGATSVITHLAAALHGSSEGSPDVCVLDLDLQSGDVASYVGARSKFTFSDLFEAGGRLDSEFLRSAMTTSRQGFSIVAAPDAVTPLETVNAEHVLRMLSIARREYDYAIVDLPADWSSWTLSVALAASEVLLITDLSIGSLRQAKKRLELLWSVGLEKSRIKVVVNRVERRLFKTIGIDEVREALGCEVIATLADEGNALRAAQDEGLLISEVNRRSKFAADIEELARLVQGGNG